jgi:hypothetical protein
MNHICGERLSQRLHGRVEDTVQRSALSGVVTKRFANLLERASRRMGQIILRIIQKDKAPCFVAHHTDVPMFQPENLENPNNWKQLLLRILNVGAVFNLFVFMFYQSSDDPAFKRFSSSCSRDEKAGVPPLFSSLFFCIREWFGLGVVGHRILLVFKKSQPVMERSYV